MIELTNGNETIVVNPNNISTIVAYAKGNKTGSRLHMNDGSIVLVDEDILDIMQKIVDSRFGVEGGVQ